MPTSSREDFVNGLLTLLIQSLTCKLYGWRPEYKSWLLDQRGLQYDDLERRCQTKMD